MDTDGRTSGIPVHGRHLIFFFYISLKWTIIYNAQFHYFCYFITCILFLIAFINSENSYRYYFLLGAPGEVLWVMTYLHWAEMWCVSQRHFSVTRTFFYEIFHFASETFEQRKFLSPQNVNILAVLKEILLRNVQFLKWHMHKNIYVINPGDTGALQY